MVQNAKGDVRTSGNILVTITSMLQPFLSGTLHELFCTETNWTPELVLEQGKLTIIAFPTLLYKQLGVLAQVIFKAAFAQACGARVDDPNSIPVILYADEAQNFMTEDDARLAEMGRSKRVAMVYGTQNIGNYVRALGGQNAQIITESMLGNFGTLFFHANKHPATNEFASKIIGRRMQYRRTMGSSGGKNVGISGGDSTATSGNRSWTRSIAESWGLSGGKSKSHQKGTSYSQGGGHSSSTDQPYPMGTYSSNYSGGKNASQSVSENAGWNQGGNTSDSYAESIGTTHTTQRGWNQSVNEGWNQGINEHMDSDLEPAIFVGGLRTGGPEHDFVVDAVTVQTGRTFHDRNWTKVSFRQG
ncbi:MAG: TraM recognition domain-containing protein, partial [Pseudomonadota bacterium]